VVDLDLRAQCQQYIDDFPAHCVMASLNSS